MTIQDYLSDAEKYLPNSPTAKLDVIVLLQHVLHVEESFLYAHAEDLLSSEQEEKLENYLKQRYAGKPIAYILGEKEFYALTFKVNENVLVPRPDTELLVDLALQKMSKDRAYHVLDLGTGSGAIALSIATHRPLSQFIATDISLAALDVAKQNAKQLTVENVSFIQSSWYEHVPHKKFDVIVSNPPYIARGDADLEAQVLQQEPVQALLAEQEGLADLFHIIECAGEFLCKGGCLLLEHGYQQAEAVANYMRNNGFSNIVTKRDLSDLDRVTLAKYS